LELTSKGAEVYQHPPISVQWQAPRPSRDLQVTAPTARRLKSHNVLHQMTPTRCQRIHNQKPLSSLVWCLSSSHIPEQLVQVSASNTEHYFTLMFRHPYITINQFNYS